MQKKKYHNKSARLLSVLQPNQTVRLQTDKDFDRKGFVTGIATRPSKEFTLLTFARSTGDVCHGFSPSQTYRCYKMFANGSQRKAIPLYLAHL